MFEYEKKQMPSEDIRHKKESIRAAVPVPAGIPDTIQCRPLLQPPEIAQLKRYVVSKSTPLTQVTQEQEPEGKKTSEQTVWDKTIAALRRRFPLSIDKSEYRDGLREDAHPQFAAEKSKKADSLAKLRDKYPIKDDDPEYRDHLRTEHYGPSFSSEKDRRKYELTKNIIKPYISTKTAPPKTGRSATGASIANAIKTLTGDNNWTGAHLIKDSWGGAANMMNVVAWRDAAESEWSEKFEAPIDDTFLLLPVISAHVSVEVIKEDELIPQNSTEDFTGTEDTPEAKWIRANVERRRWTINRAVETVPLSARGSYEIKHRGSFLKKDDIHLNSDTIGYDDAKTVAEESFANSAAAFTEKLRGIPDQIQVKKPRKQKKSGEAPPPQTIPEETPRQKTLNEAKALDVIRNNERKKRSRDRKDAIYDEIKTLYPDTFHLHLEPYTEEELQSLEDLGYDVTVR